DARIVSLVVGDVDHRPDVVLQPPVVSIGTHADDFHIPRMGPAESEAAPQRILDSEVIFGEPLVHDHNTGRSRLVAVIDLSAHKDGNLHGREKARPCVENPGIQRWSPRYAKFQAPAGAE